MNDRFKFRVWQTELKEPKMKYNSGLIINNNEIIEDGCVVMQCTGLKDKNGKLIYEGDVVIEKGSDFHWVVIWSTEVTQQWSLRRLEPNSPYPHIVTFTSLLQWKEYEVIGNIFENKELLNAR